MKKKQKPTSPGIRAMEELLSRLAEARKTCTYPDGSPTMYMLNIRPSHVDPKKPKKRKRR